MSRVFPMLVAAAVIVVAFAVIIPAFAQDIVTPAPGQGCCESGARSGDIVYWASPEDKPSDNTAAYHPTETDINIGAIHFFKINTPAAGYTVAQRETLVLKRLTEVFSACKLGPVTVKHVRGKPTVYVSNVRLITVYPQDVAASGAPSAEALAQSWAQSVRDAILKTAPTNCVPVHILAQEMSGCGE